MGPYAMGRTNAKEKAMMTNTTSRFEGAVYDVAHVDIGTNRQGERVVRIDLTYDRGTRDQIYTFLLTLPAAIALRNFLDGAFDAAGLEDGNDRE